MRIVAIVLCLAVGPAFATPAFAQITINPCEGYTPADLKSPLPFLSLARCRAKCMPAGGRIPSDAELQACIDGRSGAPAPTSDSTSGSSPTSNFDSGAEGWTVGSFPDNGPYDRVIGAGLPNWGAADGRRGGAISLSDPGAGNFFFGTPPSFLGDKRAYYGGQLRYDLRTEGGTYFDEADVILISQDLVLVYSSHLRPTAQWTTFSIPLSEGGWRVGSPTGRQVTGNEFERALSRITALRIRGEFGNGPDKGWLTNVALLPRRLP